MQVQCLQNVYGIDESNFINSDYIATITRQSTGRMLIVTKWKQLVLVDVHVLGMGRFSKRRVVSHWYAQHECWI